MISEKGYSPWAGFPLLILSEAVQMKKDIRDADNDGVFRGAEFAD